MDVTKIKDRTLSSLLAHHYICRSCQIVDRDGRRSHVGEPCSNCGKPSPGSLFYFPASVLSMLNLIQEQYHLGPSLADEQGSSKIPTHHVAIIIFFCTLLEALLNNLLIHIMHENNVPEGVITRLLKDHKNKEGRVGKVFPSITGKKWSATLTELCNERSYDYIAVEKFYNDTADIRNKFIHTGQKWSISLDLPDKCLNNLESTINLFVDLHNKLLAQ